MTEINRWGDPIDEHAEARAMRWRQFRRYGAVGVCLVAGLVILMNVLAEPTPAPFELYPQRISVPPEEWGQFITSGRPEGTGWVAVPGHSGYSEMMARMQGMRDNFVSDGDNPIAMADEDEPEHLKHPPLTDQDCVECHADIVDSFRKTAHFRTSAWPDAETILASFEAGRNTVHTGHPGLYFEMASRDDAFYVGVNAEDDEHRYRMSQQIAMVTGSGNHGQSYLFREKDAWCQLPVSYFSEIDSWTNSPGTYIDGTADFARPITPRCLECHTTWFRHQSSTVNHFSSDDFILGVRCSRCHGSLREHVEYHRAHPDADEGQRIVNPSRLVRERANEVCAQCHSGVGQPRQPALSFQPGQSLADFIELDMSGESINDDPHSANQLARLQRSRCFQQSEDMTCATCHDPHSHERGNTALFVDRCLSCHTVEQCGESAEFGDAIRTGCIKCHLPAKRDEKVTSERQDGAVIALLRDHHIAIWPKFTDIVREELRAALRRSEAQERSNP